MMGNAFPEKSISREGRVCSIRHIQPFNLKSKGKKGRGSSGRNKPKEEEENYVLFLTSLLSIHTTKRE